MFFIQLKVSTGNPITCLSFWALRAPSPPCTFLSPASQHPEDHACLLIAELVTHCWQFVPVLHFFVRAYHGRNLQCHMASCCVAEKQTASLSKLSDRYFHFSPLCPASPVFLQLYGANGDCAVSRLPRGLREQPQLRLADHLRARHQDSSGIQRLWPRASLWLPHYQGWGPVRERYDGPFLWRWGSLSPHVQQQRAAAGVSGGPLDVRQRIQHHLQQ